MSHTPSPLSQVHLVMDAYRSRHSSYFYNIREHRSVITLGKKILSTHLFEWEVNPFDPSERDTFEHGSINSQYELTIHGIEFEHKYLNLLRNRFRYDDDFRLLCQDNVQYQPSYIPWSLEERIKKLEEYDDFLKLGIDLRKDAVLEETVEILVSSHSELSYLERLLDESSLFKRTYPGNIADTENPDDTEDTEEEKREEDEAKEKAEETYFAMESDFDAPDSGFEQIEALNDDFEVPEYTEYREEETSGNRVRVYTPYKVLGIKFVLKQIDLNDRIPNGSVVLQVDDDSIEYVDIYCNTESRSKLSFHLWSCTSANFAQNVADFIDYRYRIPRFAAFVERIFDHICPKAKSPTDVAAAAVRHACIKHPYEQADAITSRMLDFVCLNRINPVLELVSPPQLEVRLGRSVRLQTRYYPDMGRRDLKLYCRTSRDQIAAVNITPEYAEIKALAVGDTELYFFDGISDRKFHSVAVSVINPVYCTQIVVQPDTVIMPARATTEVSLFYEPKEALDAASLNWSTDNPSVAEPVGSCQILSGQPGTAHITVQGEDVQTQLNVIVKPRIKSIQTDKPRYEAYVNQIVPISITTLPADCYDNSIDARIRDTAILSINSQGQFVARSQGVTTVTLCSKAEPGVSTSFEVKVDFMPEPKTPAIKHFFSLLVLWLLLCWAAYLPLLIFAGQLYFAGRAVSENKGNVITVAAVLLLQLLFQLFIL